MKFPDYYDIPQAGKVSGSVKIPGSKSITNRALMIASLAKGSSRLFNLLDSVDTRMMLNCLEKLGVRQHRHADGIEISGPENGFNSESQVLYVENSGTTSRFLTPALTLGKGKYVLDGNQRMRERPIKPLIDAMKQLGCQITDIESTGCLPLGIQAEGFPGGKLKIQGDISSQYISALIMVAPYAFRETEIHVTGNIVSKDYIDMTVIMMRDFGAEVEWKDDRTLAIQNTKKYSGRDYFIEADMSSASYFFATAAITGGSVKVEPVNRNSIQGDQAFLRILQQMGCEVIFEENSVTVKGGGPLKAVEVDMNSMSDVAPTLAAVALFAEGETKIRNVYNMRLKECDRISAVVSEFLKIGADITEYQDGFYIKGMKPLHGAELATYDDHRMAMTFSLIGLKIPGIRILAPECVTKTFPGFYESFFELLKN